MLFKFIKKMIYYLAFRPMFKPVKNGYEKIPETGGVIICANHTSNWDVVALILTLPRELRFMAKESLFNVFLVGSVIKMSGAFPVKRGGADIGTVKKAMSLLKDGEALAMFPEATRVRKGKSVDSIKAGAAMFAVKARVPVVPIGIKASYKLFSKVHINVGEPMNFEEYYGKKATTEDFDEIAAKIFNRVVELSKKD